MENLSLRIQDRYAKSLAGMLPLKNFVNHPWLSAKIVGWLLAVLVGGIRISFGPNILAISTAQVYRLYKLGSDLLSFANWVPYSGEVSERLKEPVSKTGVPFGVPRVRIPPSPIA